jgi:hypothetical protein
MRESLGNVFLLLCGRGNCCNVKLHLFLSCSKGMPNISGSSHLAGPSSGFVTPISRFGKVHAKVYSDCAAALRIAPRDIQVPLAPSGSRRVIPFAATVLRSLALLRYRSRASSHNDLTPLQGYRGLLASVFDLPWLVGCVFSPLAGSYAAARAYGLTSSVTVTGSPWSSLTVLAATKTFVSACSFTTRSIRLSLTRTVGRR